MSARHPAPTAGLRRRERRVGDQARRAKACPLHADLALAASVLVAVAVVTWIGAASRESAGGDHRAPVGSGPVARDRPAVVATARAGALVTQGSSRGPVRVAAPRCARSDGVSLRIDAGSEVAFETSLACVSARAL